MVNRPGRPCKAQINPEALWCTNAVDSKLQLPAGCRRIDWGIFWIKQAQGIERFDLEIRRKHPVQEFFGEIRAELHMGTVRFRYFGQDTSCNTMRIFRDGTPAAPFLSDNVA